MGEPRQRLVIAVATYRRPALLDALLPILMAQVEQVGDLLVDVDIIVVDNDPDRSAEPIVRSWQNGRPGGVVPALTYTHEPQPGISAARNMALRLAVNHDFLVFIDDDEQPGPRWLALLISTQRRFQSAGVLGPVLAEYMAPPDPWIVAGGFFVRQRQPTGSIRAVGFTGNLLLELGVVRALGLSFEEEFGLSGGEDSLFTTKLTMGGGVIRWCDEAFVHDLVPPERATRRWVLARRFRGGTSHSRMKLHLAPSTFDRTTERLTLTAAGLVRAVGGGLRYGLGVVVRSDRHEARGLRTAYRGLGMTAGAWGYLHKEYRRRTMPPE